MQTLRNIEPNKITMETIDLTPTWAGLMPALVEIAANGTTAEGRQQAMAELMRLAKIVDEMNEKAKQTK